MITINIKKKDLAMAIIGLIFGGMILAMLIAVCATLTEYILMSSLTVLAVFIVLCKLDVIIKYDEI